MGCHQNIFCSSIHKHHKIQGGTKDQIFLMDFPTLKGLQHTKAPPSELGMAQVSKKSEKNMFHICNFAMKKTGH